MGLVPCVAVNPDHVRNDNFRSGGTLAAIGSNVVGGLILRYSVRAKLPYPHYDISRPLKFSPLDHMR